MSRRIAYILPFLICLALSLTVLAGLHLEEQRHLQETRLEVFYKLSNIQSDFESGLRSRLEIPVAIRSYIALNPDLDQSTFDRLTRGLLNDMSGIRYIELAKDDMVSHVFPHMPSEDILGRNLPSDFPSWVRDLVDDAREAGQTRISPPMSVMEGGEAIISATPVYLRDATSGDKSYWGMILMLIDTRTLFREAGLVGRTPTLNVALMDPTGPGHAGHMLYGNKHVLSLDPVVMHILIPGGFWTIAAIPTNGWHPSERRNHIIYGGGTAIAAISLLLFLSIHLLLRHIKEREQSRQIIQNVKSIILRVDMDGVITYINEYAEEFYGYKPEELIGQKLVGSLIHESNLEGKSAGRYVEQLLKNPASHPFNETVNICKNGEMVWVSWANETVLDDTGRQTGLLCVGTDITDRKLMEEAVKVRERQYRLLAENVTDVIFGLDADLRYTYISPSDQHVRGFARYDVLGRSMSDFLPRQSADALASAVDRLKSSVVSPANPPSTSLDLEFICSDSSTIWLETRVGLLLNEDGDTIGLQGVARDINDRKLAQALRDDVDRMTRHDLKTPLGAVISLPEEVRRHGNLNAQQAAMLDTIRSAGTTMLDLINRSLDLYKMESGTYVVHKTELDVPAVIEGIKGDVQAIIREKGISIGLEIDTPDPDGGFTVMAEPDLFKVMLSNLVLNGLQASPNGGALTITLSRNDEVDITVRNKGEVPKQLRDTFFDKYTTSKKNGTGLGTYSARLMARTLGGDISLDTGTPGETCVTVTLPE